MSTEKIKVSDIRAKFPMYADMTDDQLLSAVRKKFYADIPLKQFTARIDYDTERERLNPASDSFIRNLLPAAGAGIASIGRAVGLGPLLTWKYDGIPGTKAEADRLDAPLNDAPGGTTGRLLGSAAVLAPTAFIPGANTLLGASAIGAGTGIATTEGGLEDRAKGGALGAGGGLLGTLAGRGLAALPGVVKGLTDPFYKGGRDKIAGRALQRFSTDPEAVMRATGGPTVTGAVPTVAEAAKDRGLATLERALGTMDQQAADDFLNRYMANNAARVNTLNIVAGDATAPSKVAKLSHIASQPRLEAAQATRSAAANASYGAARKAGVNGQMAEAMSPQIESLMKRPSIQAAIEGAKRLAKEEGVELADMGNAQGLQYVKQELDDMIGALGPKEANKLRLLTQTSNDLKTVLDEIAPALRQADAEFAMNSIAVDRAKVGRRLANATSGSIRDFSGNRTLQANAFSKALNDEQQLLKQATGRKTPRSLEDLMTPSQMDRILGVRDELETVSNLAKAANGPGSQTAKMLASQNLLENIAGPMGIPKSWVSSTLSQTAMRPVQFALKTTEERIQQSVAKGLLSVNEAQRLMRIAQNIDNAKPSEIALLARAMAPGVLGYQAANNGN